MRFADLQVGQSAERTKLMTESLINAYAELTGDFSPVHIDEAAAAKTRFGTRIAHGMLSVSFLSALIGMDLPGPGTIWVAEIQAGRKTWRHHHLARGSPRIVSREETRDALDSVPQSTRGDGHRRRGDNSVARVGTEVRGEGEDQ